MSWNRSLVWSSRPMAALSITDRWFADRTDDRNLTRQDWTLLLVGKFDGDFDEGDLSLSMQLASRWR